MIAGRHESRFSCPECGYRDKSPGTRIEPQLRRDGGFNFLNYSHYYVTFDVGTAGMLLAGYSSDTCVELIKAARTRFSAAARDSARLPAEEFVAR
jgi:hypothetical protein